MESNRTNIVKDIFIIPSEDIHKKIAPRREKVLTLEKADQILKKKIKNINSR